MGSSTFHFYYRVRGFGSTSYSFDWVFSLLSILVAKEAYDVGKGPGSITRTITLLGT